MMQTLREQFNQWGEMPNEDAKNAIRGNLFYQIRNFERANNIIGEEVKGIKTEAISVAWRPASIVALIAVMVLGSASVVVAKAERSDPGDGLFVVKRLIEKTEAMTKVSAVNRTVFASNILDKRMNELKRVASVEIDSESAGGQDKAGTVALAVSEVNKQVEDVDSNFQKMKDEEKQNDGKVASAAVRLNRQIRNYYQELKHVKDQVGDGEAEGKIDEALKKVEDVNSKVLEVIVDKHERGSTEVGSDEIEAGLVMHVEQLKDKVAAVTERLGERGEDQEDLSRRTAEVKTRIAEAEKALEDDKYSLVLTLAKDSSEILKMLYGEVTAIESGGTGADNNATSSEPVIPEVKGTSTAETIEPNNIEKGPIQTNMGTSTEPTDAEVHGAAENQATTSAPTAEANAARNEREFGVRIE